MENDEPLGDIAREVASQVADLEKIFKEKWSEDYNSRDLAEEVLRLKDQLRNSAPFSPGKAPPKTPATALEARLEEKVQKLESKVETLEKNYGDTLSQNWELRYRCEDLAESVWRLKEQLRDSVTLSDAQRQRPPHGSGGAKTALERKLERDVWELQWELRYGKFCPRPRRRSI